MYSFLFASIPCLLLYFLTAPFADEPDAAGTGTRHGSYWLAFCLGFFPAIAWCIIDEFFIFATHRFTDSLSACYVYLLVKDSLLPTLPLSGLYLLLSRRPMENRTFALLPLLSAFYMAYLPYTVTTGTERFSFFLCLVKPLLTCAHIALITLGGRGLCRCIKSGMKALAAAFAALVLLAFALPALAECLWYLLYSPVIYGSITAFLLACMLLLPVFLPKIAGKTLDKSL